MIGTSALWFDIDEKLNFILSSPTLDYLEFGVDTLDDLNYLKSKIVNKTCDIAFHLPLKTNPVEDILPLREANLHYVEAIYREALKLNPLYFNMHLGYVFLWKLNKNRKYYIDLACEYIKHLLDIDKNTIIYIENVYSFLDKKSSDLSSFGCYEKDFVEIIKKVNSRRLKFCYDTGHGIIQNIDFSKSFLIEDALLHLNYNDSTWDQHLGIYKMGNEGKELFLNAKEGKGYKHVLFEMPIEELKKSFYFLNI